MPVVATVTWMVRRAAGRAARGSAGGRGGVVVAGVGRVRPRRVPGVLVTGVATERVAGVLHTKYY